MVDSTISLDERIREVWVREALEDQFKKYKDFKIEKEWEQKWQYWSSNHAQFALIRLSKKKQGGRRRTHQFVVKRYISVRSEDTMYDLVHHPDFLFTRELRNLDLIRKITRAGLVPTVCASSNIHNLIVMEHLPGKSYKEQLIRVHQESEQGEGSPDHRIEFQEFLYRGVQQVARFVGTCNSRRERFFEAHDGYEREAGILQQAQQQLFKEHLLRAVYLFDPQLSKEVPYSRQVAYDHLTTKGINLDKRLSELNEMSTGFGTKSKLVHGDLNPDHLKERKILDLEKFGPGDEVDDISSFCVVSGAGNNRIIESGELGHILNRYLAFEHAYETRNGGEVKYLEQCKNGDFLDYTAQKMAAPEYANFMLNFFAYAIRKNIQLAALYGRSRNGGETGPNHVYELFQEVLLLDNSWTDHCSNPTQVRDYFHAGGSLLHDLSIVQFPNGFLARLKEGTAARDIGRAMPKFSRE